MAKKTSKNTRNKPTVPAGPDPIIATAVFSIDLDVEDDRIEDIVTIRGEIIPDRGAADVDLADGDATETRAELGDVRRGAFTVELPLTAQKIADAMDEFIRAALWDNAEEVYHSEIVVEVVGLEGGPHRIDVKAAYVRPEIRRIPRPVRARAAGTKEFHELSLRPRRRSAP